MSQAAPPAPPGLVVVGDALLDRDVDGRVDRLCPDAPAPVLDDPVQGARPGGAGLAAALAAELGHAVTLVTALGADPVGRELAALLAEAGVHVLDLGLGGPSPEKVRVRAAGRTLLRIDRGGAPAAVGPPDAHALAAIAGASAVLVADYGRGVPARPELRAALEARAAAAPVVWDPHPRGGAPVPGVAVATPSAAEARDFAARAGAAGARPADHARALLKAWGARAVCVTLGAEGVLLARAGGPGDGDGRRVPTGGARAAHTGDGGGLPALEGGAPREARSVPAPVVTGGDACGAGDAFASALAAALAGGSGLDAAVEAAVARAARWVGAGGAGAWTVAAADEPAALAGQTAAAAVARTRARGGTVVATGGCFDLLHAGHVSVLQGARALGDCLIVCLNADDSVRRLKGSDRPLVPEEDRAAVLSALACVDAVAVFEEDTPERLLVELRPDVWVKGGDYDVGELPEARLVESWGGRAEILPYVDGRSTTRLIEEVASRVAA